MRKASIPATIDESIAGFEPPVRAILRKVRSAARTRAARERKRLEAAGIVRDLTGRKRGRAFAYERYLDVLNEGTTTPLARS